jgi:hypothetical protein
MYKCHGCGKAQPGVSYADVARGGNQWWRDNHKQSAKTEPVKKLAKVGEVVAYQAALVQLRGVNDPSNVDVAGMVSKLEGALTVARNREKDDKPIPKRLAVLGKNREHKLGTSQRADDEVAAIKVKIEALNLSLGRAEGEAAKRKDELAEIELEIAKCQSMAIASAGADKIEVGGVEVPAAAKTIESVLPVDSQRFSAALMADPALQPLFEAVNLATRRMVEQVQQAAEKLKHDSAVAETQPVTVEVPDSPAGTEVMDDETIEEMEETDMESFLLTAGVTLTEEQRGSIKQKAQEDGFVSKRRKKSRG